MTKPTSKSDLELLLSASLLLQQKSDHIKSLDAYIARLETHNDMLRREVAKLKRLEGLRALAIDIRRDVQNARLDS